jgi:phosphoenolpyruvate synthase/pyruvate phosphate dikinase
VTLAARSDFVVDLARLGAQDLDRGGGKAANLGELLRAGFPVPPVFVITTAAPELVMRDAPSVLGGQNLAIDTSVIYRREDSSPALRAFLDVVRAQMTVSGADWGAEIPSNGHS